MSRRLCIAILLCSVSNATVGYEVGTHAKITDEAYKRSALSDSTKLRQYGLYDLSHIAGVQFKEVAGAQVVDRGQFEYERQVEWATLMDKNGSELCDGSGPLIVSTVSD